LSHKGSYRPYIPNPGFCFIRYNIRKHFFLLFFSFFHLAAYILLSASLAEMFLFLSLPFLSYCFVTVVKPFRMFRHQSRLYLEFS